MVPVLDQDDFDIGGDRLLGDGQRQLPRHIGVRLAVQQADGAIDLKRTGQDVMPSPVLDQLQSTLQTDSAK